MAEPDDGYIVEFRQVGGITKVSAIDPATGTEVSIVGAPGATQKQLSDLAIQKLVYVLEKKSR